MLIHPTLSQGEEVDMGRFADTYCFANNPYECEILFDGADFIVDEEFKCSICTIEVVRQYTDADNDLIG